MYKNNRASRYIKGPTLLKLPAELRNRIYEYALTYGGGIVDEAEAGPTRRHLAMFWIHHPNRGLGLYQSPILLQFVRKQLRQETRGLSIKLNDLTLRGTKPDTALQQCERFLRHCAATPLTWIKCVHIVDNLQYENLKEALYGIDHVCPSLLPF
ncbi:hypothetical protein K458DRAFT_396766 [Lentithecium fluviatile CBS 122367]|uniref:Uncharacterized protein n=1 Tax=Lentithecium fluviatile CBS 122367 TaxID=1168545 RepID=A0A6G1IEG5_9PLEO|nr:hypothetical protein K458DRAFT_396766 [Lentithecium fluviatile CBS 122367]